MTSGAPRILITGFRPFPGAPYNPTEKLVERLVRLRRPALDNAVRIGHVFPVTYSAVDRELPALIAEHHPDVLLMFGLAARTPFMRVETRARNTVTQIWPDAEHANVRSRTIDSSPDSIRRFGPHTQRLLRAAQDTGVAVKSSLNAGYYLCNYLSWRAIEATRACHRAETSNPALAENHPPNSHGPHLAAFIHVPLVPRATVHVRKGHSDRVTFEQLVDAGEAVLIELVRLARRPQASPAA